MSTAKKEATRAAWEHWHTKVARLNLIPFVSRARSRCLEEYVKPSSRQMFLLHPRLHTLHVHTFTGAFWLWTCINCFQMYLFSCPPPHSSYCYQEMTCHCLIAIWLVTMAVRSSQLPPFSFDPFEPLLDGNLEICFSALQCAHPLELSIYYRYKKKLGITTDGSQLEEKTDTNFCWLQFQLSPG